MHDLQQLIQQIINGLSVGSIYALIAVGYTMVYGVLQLINFAHGDVFMVGAILTLVLARAFGWVAAESWLYFATCAALSVIACGILGFLIERLAYRPLRDKPRINSLITAIGISLLLEYGGQHRAIFGPTPQPFPTNMLPGINENLPAVGGLIVSRADGLILLSTVVLMIVLTYIVLKTKTGLALP